MQRLLNNGSETLSLHRNTWHEVSLYHRISLSQRTKHVFYLTTTELREINQAIKQVSMEMEDLESWPTSQTYRALDTFLGDFFEIQSTIR